MRKYIYLGVALILALVGWRLNVLENKNKSLRLENESLKIKASQNQGGYSMKTVAGNAKQGA